MAGCRRSAVPPALALIEMPVDDRIRDKGRVSADTQKAPGPPGVQPTEAEEIHPVCLTDAPAMSGAAGIVQAIHAQSAITGPESDTPQDRGNPLVVRINLGDLLLGPPDLAECLCLGHGNMDVEHVADTDVAFVRVVRIAI